MADLHLEIIHFFLGKKKLLKKESCSVICLRFHCLEFIAILNNVDGGGNHFLAIRLIFILEFSSLVI